MAGSGSKQMDRVIRSAAGRGSASSLAEQALKAARKRGRG
jgi:hypothetical protein